uniref:Uncharacterized protein n=1 Tax=Corethron hystrix TaxID=216773 RepID=A0A7S1FTH7_9STRA|mmetsp:Transcript_27906/g.63896  ORF Transcript_27906/g.63896 Transcript_27906/m.63896 type:complete len:122 (+) Transcript_27906:551-916(+)
MYPVERSISAARNEEDGGSTTIAQRRDRSSPSGDVDIGDFATLDNGGGGGWVSGRRFFGGRPLFFFGRSTGSSLGVASREAGGKKFWARRGGTDGRTEKMNASECLKKNTEVEKKRRLASS